MDDTIEYMREKIRAAGPDADTRAMERQLSLLKDAALIYEYVKTNPSNTSFCGYCSCSSLSWTDEEILNNRILMVESGIVYADYIPIVHTKPFANQEEHDAWYIANGIDPASVEAVPMEHCVENADGSCMY